VSSAGKGDDPESIGKAGSKIVVDVPRFTEASQEQYGRATATPIDDLELSMFSRLGG